MLPSPLRTLILSLEYPNRASYYSDWRDAFCGSTDYACHVVNILDLRPKRLARMVEEYDAIILLHSCNSDTLDYLAPLTAVLGNRNRAKLVSFVGNEFNSPYVSMTRRVELLREARCDLIATQLLQEAGEFLYGGTGARIISLPHALNPLAFSPGPPDAARRLDIGVKGYRYPPFLGDDDRNRMVAYFLANASRLGLAVDISEDRRLGRLAWAEFLAQCRGTISTETGSWYLERDDVLIKRIREYLKSKRSGFVIGNEGWLRRAARRLPSPIKSVLWEPLRRGPVKFEVFDDFTTPFAELEERFFRHAKRPPVYGKAVSSRHFEAIGTKTCQIMLKGRFNDILVADVHYLAVESDFSNIDEIVARFKDAGERRRIAETAYAHVMASHTYAHRVAAIRSELGSLA
jgi:spore maturation protein CgeB